MLEGMLGDIVKSCFEKAQEQQKAEGYIRLERLSVDLLPSLFLGSMYPSTLDTSGLGFYLSVLVC